MKARVVPFHKGAAVRLQPEAPAKDTLAAKVALLQRVRPHAAEVIEELVDKLLAKYAADRGGKGGA